MTDDQQDLRRIFAGLDRLPEWKRLRRIRDDLSVCVLGLGAAGQAVLNEALHNGVGQGRDGGILGIDLSTRLEPGNAAKSYLAPRADCLRGRRKLPSVARAVRARFPGTRFATLEADVRCIGAGRIRQFFHGDGGRRRPSVLVAALDNWGASAAANALAWNSADLMVDVKIDRRGTASYTLVRPPRGACIQCVWSDAEYRTLAERNPCAPVAAPGGPSIPVPTATLAVAGFVVADILDALAGAGDVLDRSVFVDVPGKRLFSTPLVRNRECLFHHAAPPAEPPVVMRSDRQPLTVGALISAARSTVGRQARLTFHHAIAREGRCLDCLRVNRRPGLAVLFDTGRRRCRCDGTRGGRLEPRAFIPADASLDELAPFSALELAKLGMPAGEHVLVRGAKGKPHAVLEVWPHADRDREDEEVEP